MDRDRNERESSRNSLLIKDVFSKTLRRVNFGKVLTVKKIMT